MFGPEPWTTVGDARWCQFDRWFALTTAADFDSNLDELEAQLVGRPRGSLHSRRDLEAKLSHLADLRLRLTAAGVDISRQARAEAADKTTVAKARRKVLEQAVDGRAMTEAMRDTPRAVSTAEPATAHGPPFRSTRTAGTTSSSAAAHRPG